MNVDGVLLASVISTAVGLLTLATILVKHGRLLQRIDTMENNVLRTGALLEKAVADAATAAVEARTAAADVRTINVAFNEHVLEDEGRLTRLESVVRIKHDD